MFSIVDILKNFINKQTLGPGGLPVSSRSIWISKGLTTHFP